LVHCSMLTTWRYSDKPFHIVLFQHCLMNAFYKDIDDISVGSFKTSVAKLAKASRISPSKIKLILKDLSSGPNPELLIDTSTSQQYGYTKITVLNFEQYQLNQTSVKGSHNKPNPRSQDNLPLVTTNTEAGHDMATRAGHDVATKEYEVLRNNNTLNINNGDGGVSSSTDVGSSFEELIEVYPGQLTKGAEAKALFNNLNSTDKEKCITFAKQLQKIWKENGNEKDKEYIKGLYRYINEKLFNGLPNDVLPKSISVELKPQIVDSRDKPEFIAQFGEFKKPKTMAELAAEKFNK